MSYQLDLFINISKINYNGIHECLLNGADINYYRPDLIMLNTPLMTAINTLNVTMIKFIIDKGGDLNTITAGGNDMVQHINDVLKLQYRFDDKGLHAWIKTYLTQKRFIETNHKFFKSLKECNFIHPDILIEYAHLNAANDLNLL